MSVSTIILLSAILWGRYYGAAVVVIFCKSDGKVSMSYIDFPHTLTAKVRHAIAITFMGSPARA